jgi:hypothetical protein
MLVVVTGGVECTGSRAGSSVRHWACGKCSHGTIRRPTHWKLQRRLTPSAKPKHAMHKLSWISAVIAASLNFCRWLPVFAAPDRPAVMVETINQSI